MRRARAFPALLRAKALGHTTAHAPFSRRRGHQEFLTPQVSDTAIGALITGIKQGRAGDGFVAAIEQRGAVLTEYSPPGRLNRDELPNKLVEI
jgi:hypothetical protein